MDDKIYEIVHNEGDLTQKLDIHSGDEMELIASQKKEIVGEYKHPKWLFILGIIVTVFMLFSGIRSLGNISALFH